MATARAAAVARAGGRRELARGAAAAAARAGGGKGVRSGAAAAARAGGGEGVRAATACGRRRRLLLLLPWPLASTPRHRRQPPPPPAPTIAFAATAPVAGDDPILLDVDVGAYGVPLPVPCSRSSPARCCWMQRVYMSLKSEDKTAVGFESGGADAIAPKLGGKEKARSENPKRSLVLGRSVSPKCLTCSRCTPDPGHTFYPVSRRRPPHFEPVVVTAEKRAALPLSSPFAETRRRFPASSSHRSARRLGQKSWRCHWLADCNCQCGDWTTSVVGIELVKSHTNTMQGIFACGSISSPHGSCFRPACLAVDDLRLFYKINSITCGAYSWRWCVKKLHMRTNRRQMGTTVRTNAKWLFGGDDRSSSNARLERSESANEDILIFYFQLDLQTRIQYALNIEQFDVAKQLREKLTEIETEIIRQREAKRGSSKTEAQDKAINLLRVRADLQKAVDSENYALAAALRDEIAKLETESLAVSAKALAYQNVEYAFRLGQKVRHKVHGYRAVICGMDHVCCESKSWMETANVENLSKGPNQPFYQLQKKILQKLKYQRNMISHVMKLLGMKMTMMAARIAESGLMSVKTGDWANPEPEQSTAICNEAICI
uniref:Hemimethylated DNA-binding domain-containing protein n=1 Tax=Oryza rufipogon TaxID=4529 RepID=A0A0E0N2V6_ORYRU